MNSDDENLLLGPHVLKIAILHDHISADIQDRREITAGSTFLYEKELKLRTVMLDTFDEMMYAIRQFELCQSNLLSNGSPELMQHLTELNEKDFGHVNHLVIELHAVDLSMYFKSFLLLAKAVLDKVVPLFSYRFYDNLETFSDKGDRLIARLQKNKNVQKKGELIELIERAKKDWLVAFIDLRDEYAHYSNLKEYTNFWIPGASTGKGTLKGIEDFYLPSVVVAGRRFDALGYMMLIKANLVEFIRDFLLLCEFIPDRRPKHYLVCDECRYVFAERDKARGQLKLNLGLQIRVKDQSKDYGVIVCPRCSCTTDTDLQFWKNYGVTFTNRNSD